MKKRIRNIIDKLLSNYIEKKEAITSKNKKGINIGDDSFIYYPYKISGHRNIYIGNESVIGNHSWLAAFSNYQDQIFNPKLIIGDSVCIGSYACITSIDEINIEKGTLISEHVYISDHYHGLEGSVEIEPVKKPLSSKGKVRIGKNSFIGYRVTILSGVKLGRNCVVGSHSVVTKSFPDYCMIAGVPAKLIKKFDIQQNKWINI